VRSVLPVVFSWNKLAVLSFILRYAGVRNLGLRSVYQAMIFIISPN
jgi:hypothetical protein